MIIMDNETIEINNHIYSNQIKQSLEIVKEYIKNYNLILVGGMAIDLSLKTKGTFIYHKDQIPDYDAISPDFYTHAKNITEILCKKKFPHVNLITAMHNTTVRVKVSNYTVFDSTYCPVEVYNKINTINFLGLKIIHPNNQKIDQYNSLSFLFELTGECQNIFHRMEKDISRNKILVDNFKIISHDMPTQFITIELPTNLFQYKNIKYYKKQIEVKNSNYDYFESNDNICCHGFMAYSIYYQSLKDLYEKNKYNLNNSDIKYIDKLFNECIHTFFTINKNNCKFLIPKNENITFINGNNNLQYIKSELNKIYKITKIDTYSKLLEIKPISQILYSNKYNFELFDLTGRLLSCNLFNFNDNPFIVSNYNYILSYFLMKHYYYNTNSYYLTYYNSLLNLINISNILSQSFECTNFTYSISTFGSYNYNESYYYFVTNFEYLLKNNKNSSKKPPKIYTTFPECNINKNFDQNLSEYFQINGELNNNIKYTNHLYMLNSS